MTIDPFGAEVRDGRIWGRGASDTKGSVASMLWAIYETRDLIPELDLEVSFAGFMSEESEQYGSQHYAKHHADKTDFAIVGEPTDMDAVVAHKACWWFDITTTGLAAHSSKPQLGENSISKMVRLIAAMESELPVQLAAFENEMLGLPTSSFNMIQGGSRPNIVPDECTVTLDIRATPELFAQGVDTFIQGILDETGFVDAGLHIRTKSPTLDTDPQNPIVQRFVEQGSKLVGAPWFCDAGWLAVGGIPGIAIGPGSIAQAHTEDEWIKIEDLESGAWRFAEFLRSYGK